MPARRCGIRASIFPKPNGSSESESLHGASLSKLSRSTVAQGKTYAEKDPAGGRKRNVALSDHAGRDKLMI